MQIINKNYSDININRCQNPQGFNLLLDGSLEKSNFLMVAMLEELGEIAGVLKRKVRGFNERDFNKTIKELLKEGNGDGAVEWDKLRWEKQEDVNFVRTIFQSKLNENLSVECADLLGYFDLFLANEGIDLDLAVKNKFNQVSEEMGCSQFKI